MNGRNARQWARNARVHLCARRGHSPGVLLAPSASHGNGVVCLDAAIAASLKELGYGA